MTLRVISYREAARNYRDHPRSRWPDGRRKDGERLQGFATLHPSPGFRFDASDTVMTIGSCFAREIEKALAARGFTLPALDIALPQEERVARIPNNILNKYIVQSMENEIRWGFEDIATPPEQFFLRADDGLWHDPHLLANLVPASLDRVIQRRRMVSRVMARLPECRVVVLTLGLVEAWFDNRTGTYLNGMPPRVALKTEPDRFSLHVLDHDDVLASLDRIHALIARHGHPGASILISVSPVPFKATFTGEDAVAANTYGKSVQRAAAEVFAARHANVDYFPSYEIVTQTERGLAYLVDNIHVDQPMVDHIISTVLASYLPGPAP